ncbi:MAG TPA: STAS/SEC14 domain-containing protein [Myxococcales bacterium]
MSVGFIEAAGCRILLLDFSGIDDKATALARIAEARAFVARQPKRKEILTLVDVSRMRFDNDVLAAFRDLTVHDEPWERAVAVCGVKGVGKIAFRANNLMTGSRLRAFDSREEALAWLAAEAKL